MERPMIVAVAAINRRTLLKAALAHPIQSNRIMAN
jgi:hypothetical protein